MSDTVIRVENISKLYRLGEVGTGSLAHDVNRWWHRVRGKEDPYLKVGEVNDRTKPAKQARSEKNLTTIEHGGRCENEQLKVGPKGEGAGATESKGAAGVRLAGQAGAAFPNPSTSELASDSENTSLIRSANALRSSEEQSDSKALDSPKAPPSDWVYALKDVSFEVKRGELRTLGRSEKEISKKCLGATKVPDFWRRRHQMLGIIGRNGAGKSTLLKILSRVTTQSSGQIKVRGRIASLLEVGTGFHPELTGPGEVSFALHWPRRETEGWAAWSKSNRRLARRVKRRRGGANQNIFLNGAILGMRKAEIARKFDEIVEFSGCARYIDTPVKRYSSGMYVRLAFAVAAHLEPEPRRRAHRDRLPQAGPQGFAIWEKRKPNFDC
jgi:energy-coupling factor transporter ATP-binding protein EcfA2